ncbi:MAG: MipA/OmpV family protein [Geminicoccaceae bacterium]
MRITSALTTGAAMIGALWSGGLALAQPASTAGPTADTRAGGGISLTVGAGAGVAPDYEGSDDYQAVPFWNLRAANLYHPETYVQVLGPHLYSNFLPDDHWRLGIAGQYIRERDDVEDDQVDDLRSVDASVMLGLIAGYDFLASLQNDLVLEVEGRQDISGDNGFLGTIRGRYGSLLAERWRFDALVSTTWASEDYMSSYFGIDAGDAARSGLDQFNADEGFKEVAFGASLTYRFLENWSVTGTGTYTRLIDDAADSPVVDDAGDDNLFFAGALINYRF